MRDPLTQFVRLDPAAEGITWLRPASLIRLRALATQLPLDRGKIHARQGGHYLSAFKGRGMEFDESRLYMPGDDIRNMDWRVTARTGTAHTKVFREERERPVLLWLDLNASMHFATHKRFKAVLAAELAAMLAWSAVGNGDRLGGLIFAGEAHDELRPRRGKLAALDFIGRCCHHPAWAQAAQAQRDDRDQARDQARNMARAVTRLHKVTHPGSLVFMLSDFRDMNDAAFHRLASLARHNDVVLIHVFDPIEAALPAAGEMPVTDGRRTLRVNTASAALRRHYQQRFLTRQQTMRDFCRRHRLFLLPASTAEDPLAQLHRGLGVHPGHGAHNGQDKRRIRA